MMKLSTYVTIAAIVAIIYALLLLLIPGRFVENYGFTLDKGGVVMARFFGSAMCANAVVFWINRNISSAEKSWYGLFVANVFFNIINIAIAVKAILNDVTNSLGWTTVVVAVLFAFGSGYFAFSKIA